MEYDSSDESDDGIEIVPTNLDLFDITCAKDVGSVEQEAGERLGSASGPGVCDSARVSNHQEQESR